MKTKHTHNLSLAETGQLVRESRQPLRKAASEAVRRKGQTAERSRQIYDNVFAAEFSRQRSEGRSDKEAAPLARRAADAAAQSFVWECAGD